jgi:hypothetical protein
MFIASGDITEIIGEFRGVLAKSIPLVPIVNNKRRSERSDVLPTSHIIPPQTASLTHNSNLAI